MDEELVMIEIEADLLEQVRPLCERYGLTPEELAVRFFRWVAENPEDAKAYLIVMDT